jgi:hypothetical protein
MRIDALDLLPCIVWTRALRNGYGVRNIQSGRKGWKVTYMHRLACEEANGPPPDPKALALHHCNNRACVNGRHLYWGSRSDNSEDSRRDGSMALGEKHGAVKLTREQVLEIRASKTSSYKIAPVFGVAPSTVRGIRNGHGNWKWLDDAH